MAEKKVSLKLLVDSEAKKVLFAEAGKEFIDFLFHIMSLPVSTIINLLKPNNMVGSLGALFNSIESLSSEYFQSDLDKDSVLKPNAAINVPLLSLDCKPNTFTYASTMYRCKGRECSYITYWKGTGCHTCGGVMSKAVSLIEGTDEAVSSGSGGGYVKGVVTYMVMDNLEVKPMSTISGITIINKFRVKDVSCLIEKEVEVGLKEGLAMLKASLETRAVLTTVFVGK